MESLVFMIWLILSFIAPLFAVGCHIKMELIDGAFLLYAGTLLTTVGAWEQCLSSLTGI